MRSGGKPTDPVGPCEGCNNGCMPGACRVQNWEEAAHMSPMLPRYLWGHVTRVLSGALAAGSACSSPLEPAQQLWGSCGPSKKLTTGTPRSSAVVPTRVTRLVSCFATSSQQHAAPASDLQCHTQLSCMLSSRSMQALSLSGQLSHASLEVAHRGAIAATGLGMSSTAGFAMLPGVHQDTSNGLCTVSCGWSSSWCHNTTPAAGSSYVQQQPC